jgi:hypothetical protein
LESDPVEKIGFYTFSLIETQSTKGLMIFSTTLFFGCVGTSSNDEAETAENSGITVTVNDDETVTLSRLTDFQNRLSNVRLGFCKMKTKR